MREPTALAGRLAARMLAGRRIFIAGADGRIGTAVGRALAGHGAELVLLHHIGSAATSDAEMDLRQRFGTRITSVRGDLTRPESLAQVREQLLDLEVGQLDALVNCTTGFDGHPRTLADLTVKEFRRVIEIDLVGSFTLVKELLPLLTMAGNGRIVLFSSLAGVHGRPGAAHLCAAKAGVQGLALGLARDLAPHGIRVNVVAPGPVDHPGPPGSPFSTANEVAGVVTFLASALSDPVSGQLLAVPGTHLI